MTTTENLIKRHEGLRLKPYRCISGKLTIGIGRNLDANGISKEEAEILFRNDLLEAKLQGINLVRNFYTLNEARQAVIISMIFQMGAKGFAKFKNTIKFIEAKNFEKAARNMLLSLWAVQTPRRARELSKMMKEGKFAE